MILRLVTASLAATIAMTAVTAQSPKDTAPESFRANGQIRGNAGGAATAMTIKIDKYTADADHQKLLAALKSDPAGFAAVLKKAPAVGSLTMGPRTVPIKWARTQAQGQDRKVVAATSEPVFFSGAGAVDAKPTAGYDIAVIEFVIDPVGLGKGTMAPGAKVKAGGPNGFEIEDYSGKQIELMTVTRNKG